MTALLLLIFSPLLHLPLFAHGRYIVPATIGHGSLIIRIVAYYSGDQSLKIRGLIGIVALQGASAPLLILHNYTIFMQMHDFWRHSPYMLPINYLLRLNIAWCQGIIECRLAISLASASIVQSPLFQPLSCNSEDIFLTSYHGRFPPFRSWRYQYIACLPVIRLLGELLVKVGWERVNINPEDAPCISRYSFLQLDEYKSCEEIYQSCRIRLERSQRRPRRSWSPHRPPDPHLSMEETTRAMRTMHYSWLNLGAWAQLIRKGVEGYSAELIYTLCL